MIKREKLQVLALWGVVAYTLTILGYFTLKAFGHSENFISALGSILGVTATFFAAYVAIVLFNDWKKQHNAQIKYNYLKDILSVLRENLITLAPIVNEIISAGHLYLYKDEVTDLNLKINDLEKVYASHKKALLIFKEYNLIFKDDDSLLLFLKFDVIMDKAISLIIKINKDFILNSTRLHEITTQQYMVGIPKEITNNIPSCIISHAMTPLNLCEQIEVYYDELIKHLTTYRFKE
ncbi:hypothetical protein [Acinetobacter sp.]|uniref:hypothetical protein n=1 Tax=Acinetobacter sp. TaxID=472 RepID=UPI0028AC6840|nr:hypothetical protein [Acinetobacter sp.]